MTARLVGGCNNEGGKLECGDARQKMVFWENDVKCDSLRGEYMHDGGCNMKRMTN